MRNTTQTIGQFLNWDFETIGRLEIRDTNNNLIYSENSDRFWVKYEYDSEGNRIYWEDSSGEWVNEASSKT